VGTPGRVIDYIKQGIFNTKWIRIVVIDEADRLFDLGFTQDMRFILRKLPSYEKRQSMLFSATLSYRVLELTYEYMNLPEFISVTPQDVAVEGIAQELFHVGEEQKLPLLLGLLQREKWERVLIFVNTKVGVEWLTRKLKGNGLPAEMITGDLPQKKRFQLMDRYKSGKIKILVATDVASRGIHVEDISHVINYDLPQDAENYVHRIGRTARAGKQGKAISLACERYVLHLEPVENMLGYKIPVIWPEDDWYVEDKAGPVKVASRIRDKRNGRGKPSRGGGEAPAQTNPQAPAGLFPRHLLRLRPARTGTAAGKRSPRRRGAGAGSESRPCREERNAAGGPTGRSGAGHREPQAQETPPPAPPPPQEAGKRRGITVRNGHRQHSGGRLTPSCKKKSSAAILPGPSCAAFLLEPTAESHRDRQTPKAEFKT